MTTLPNPDLLHSLATNPDSIERMGNKFIIPKTLPQFQSLLQFTKECCQSSPLVAEQSLKVLRFWVDQCVKNRWKDGLECLVDLASDPSLSSDEFQRSIWGDAPTPYSASPLIVACRQGLPDIVGVLLSANPSPHHVLMAIFASIEHKKVSICHILWEHLSSDAILSSLVGHDKELVLKLPYKSTELNVDDFLLEVIKKTNPLNPSGLPSDAPISVRDSRKPLEIMGSMAIDVLLRIDRLFACASKEHIEEQIDVYRALNKLFTHPEVLKRAPLTQALRQKKEISKHMPLSVDNVRPKKM